MPSWEQQLQETRDRLGDPPGDDPVECLRHVVVAFAESALNDPAITATSGLYPNEDWTGLTHGDLRALLALLDH